VGQRKTNLRETSAIEALLRGLQANLDFTTITDGFDSKKQAFLEKVRLIGCFVRTLPLDILVKQN